MSNKESRNIQADSASNFAMTIWMLIIGVFVGLAGVVYRLMLTYSHICFFDGGSVILSFFGSYYIVLLPVIGGLIVGILNFRFGQAVKGHGVPEVMASVDDNGIINPRVIWLKSLTSAITMGSGGSVGPEGPMVQIGAGIASNMRHFGHFSKQQVVDLAAAGSAAGIASIFNAPLAGVIFTLEVVLRKYNFTTFCRVIFAAGVSALVYRFCMGADAIYTVPVLNTVNIFDYIVYLILGAIAGLLSVFWIKSMSFSETFCAKYIKVPSYFKPALGGLFVGIVGIWLPMVMGEGHEFTALTLEGGVFFGTLLLACLFKVITNCVTLGSGGSGGVFAPAVFIGATLGAGFAGLLNLLLPDLSLNIASFAVAGIASVLAGFFHAPFTAVVMAFEITNQYSLVIPLICAASSATFVAKMLFHHSIYSLQLAHRNAVNVVSTDSEINHSAVSYKE